MWREDTSELVNLALGESAADARQNILASKIGALQPAHREIILLHDLLQFTIDDIMKITGLAEESLRMMIGEIRTLIAQQMSTSLHR